MKKLLKLSTVLVFVAAGGLFEFAEQSSAAQERTAEQVYRNVQVFKGLPASQLYPAMNFISGALGVNCTHCHVPNEFDKDDKPAKQTARRMIQMMQAINQGNFSESQAVTCHTCHRGQVKPVAVPALLLATATAVNAPDSRPTADQLLDGHVAALGGKAKLERVTTLTLKGTEIGTGLTGSAPARAVEIYRQAPHQLLIVNPQPDNDSRRAFDGQTGWQQFSGRTMGMSASELGLMRREARFDRNFNLREQFTKFVVTGQAQLGARKAWVVEATPIESRLGPMTFETEKLYFDTSTGLLIRRYLEAKTVLGSAPLATDYDDYREVDGVKWPFTIRLIYSTFSATQTFTEVRPNLPLEAARFQRPGGGQ